MSLLEDIVVQNVRNRLIDDVSKFWKLASVWVFVLIGAMPDIYNGIASMGWVDEVPGRFKWILRVLAGLGIAVRVIKQRIPNANH